MTKLIQILIVLTLAAFFIVLANISWHPFKPEDVLPTNYSGNVSIDTSKIKSLSNDYCDSHECSLGKD